MKLSDRAMLASVNVRTWAATRTDQKVTQEVAVSHGVNAKRAGHYRKYAIDPKAPSYAAVIAAAGAIRTTHYHYTLPWSQDGTRILTAMAFSDYSTAMRGKISDFEHAAHVFVPDFPRLARAAQAELNGLWNARDYPADIASKFSATIAILPLPEADDFRVKLADDAVADIRAGIQSELQSTVATAMHEPYQRLADHIGRMVERLSDPENTFRDTLVTGLAALCAALPGLNLTADPVLEDLRKRSEDLIAGIDAQVLRDVPSARADVARRAADIQATMAAYMGGN